MAKDKSDSAIKMLKANKIKWVDLQFTDLMGRLHHITIPASKFNKEAFSEGFGKLDGSSIKGFTEIFESDMILLPIPESARPIPWAPGVARILAQVHRGAKAGRFERDPRGVAEKAEAHQKELGYVSYFGPEPEFFIFDSVNLDVSQPSSGIGYKVHAKEAPWENGGSFVIRHKEGYYPAEPIDQLGPIRREMVTLLSDVFDFDIEATHHEVATAGQAEINFKYSTLVDTADKLQTLKYVVRNVANTHNMLATFMPKPIFGDNGSGMHTHFSLWTSKGRNVMFDKNDKYAEISTEGRYILGGILKHARALSAIVSPTVNSYHRLIPGYEAPVYLAWSKSNRSAVVRVPTYYKGIEEAKRIEYRAPDPSCNPYLAFSAMLMAGLDGIKKRIDPGMPVVDENIWHMDLDRRKQLKIGEIPRSLTEALDELESDNEFLKPAFSSSLLDTYIDLKREESRLIASYPHPIEVYQYLDS
ncbi:MAG: type I glutamate--ammonia ligase [Candidatus Micrarchaeota archaeon]|nr:type I glutamate--ammonia ligase [Candidatus Micrarchaeota archaeon]MDE1833789.1 type I glutamate--ammonia ligase [Candidatus Micrarchaeota archaeon]MDE1859960.1 type I glutamate--ammonia ligase [Candidatus Micrarchaeota archaeon]